MRPMLRARLLASALAFCVLPAIVTTVPAHAQYAQEVGFDFFHDQLAPYGNWLYSDRWGMVWQPTDVPDDFRPYYTDGRWVYTADLGWMWESDYDWGDIPFHYGRWVDDPDDGWLWIPGYVWAPAWVVWRSDEDYVAWMPMPPDDGFLEGDGDVSFEFGIGTISFGWYDPYFGYRHWYGHDYDDRRFARNWVCVHPRDLDDHDYSRVAVRDPDRVITILHHTRNITNYAVVNNYVVNRSVNVRFIERATGHPVEIVHARDVTRHPNLIGTFDLGRRVRMLNRPAITRGLGLPNSAPPPPRRVIDKLSTNIARPNGRQPTHLFTRSAVENPKVMAHFRGTPANVGSRWNNTFGGANETGGTQALPPRSQGGRFFEQQNTANPIEVRRPTTGNGFPAPNNSQTGQGRGAQFEHVPNFTNAPSGNAPVENEGTFPGGRRFEDGRALQHQNGPSPMNTPSSQMGPGNIGPAANQRFRQHGNRAVPNESAPNPTKGPSTSGATDNGTGGFHRGQATGATPYQTFQNAPHGNQTVSPPPSITPRYGAAPREPGVVRSQPSEQVQRNPPPSRNEKVRDKGRPLPEN